jgi:hypothetical protein
MLVPDLSLTQGQLLWAVGYGKDPDQRLKDQVRYLRQRDIPPASAAQAKGPGMRIAYDFFDLVELGLAVTGLDLGFRPKDIAAVLVDHREEMRERYAEAWESLPDSALAEDWVRSRGKRKTLIANEVIIRMHDRRGEKWGQMDFVGPEEAGEGLGLFEPVERFGDEAPRRLIPLKRLMLQWVAWALEAPEIRPGRR